MQAVCRHRKALDVVAYVVPKFVYPSSSSTRTDIHWPTRISTFNQQIQVTDIKLFKYEYQHLYIKASKRKLTMEGACFMAVVYTEALSNNWLRIAGGSSVMKRVDSDRLFLRCSPLLSPARLI